MILYNYNMFCIPKYRTYWPQFYFIFKETNMILGTIVRVATPVVKTVAFIAGIELIQKGIRNGINSWKRFNAETDNDWDNPMIEPVVLTKSISNELLDGVLAAKSTIKEKESAISTDFFKKVHEKLVNEEKLDKHDVLAIYIIRTLIRDFTVNLVHLEMSSMKAAKEAFKDACSVWSISKLFLEYDNRYNDFYKFIKVFEKNYWIDDYNNTDSYSETDNPYTVKEEEKK